MFFSELKNASPDQASLAYVQKGEREAKGVPAVSSLSNIQVLQQTIGNRAVQRMLQKKSVASNAIVEKGTIENTGIYRNFGWNNGNVIQRTAGKLLSHGESFLVKPAKGRGHGPYQIANINKIDKSLLESNKEVTYELKNRKAYITKIDEYTYESPSNKRKKKPEASWVDVTHDVENNLGLGATDKIALGDRKWLFQDKFTMDFGNDKKVDFDLRGEHEELCHTSKSSPNSNFRGNYVSIDWILYFEENNAIEKKSLNIDGLMSGESADFLSHKSSFKKNVNDMYSLGRTITENETNKPYNVEASKTIAASKYHSERDFVVKANKLDLVGKLSKSIDNIVKKRKDRLPKLLIVNLHSHENRICNDCFQFLDAFMNGDWIDELKENVAGGKGANMQVRMITSADNLASVQKPRDAQKGKSEYKINEMPLILNHIGLSQKPTVTHADQSDEEEYDEEDDTDDSYEDYDNLESKLKKQKN